MSYPRRIRLARARGAKLPHGAVNVARPTKWGNPFKVGRDGNGETCVFLHRHLIAGRLAIIRGVDVDEQRRHRRFVLDHHAELKGRDLACWCKLDGWCHADTYLTWANGPRPLSDDELTVLQRVYFAGDKGLETVSWRASPVVVALVKIGVLWPAQRRQGEDTDRLFVTPIAHEALGMKDA